MSPGRVMALDPGTRRVGVAISDPQRIIASPLEVIDAPDPLPRIGELCADYRPEVIVVGLPVSLSGTEGPAAEHARRFAEDVADATGCRVELVDERFTSRTAETVMAEGGARSRQRRGQVDKVAASVILQSYLQRQRQPTAPHPEEADL